MALSVDFIRESIAAGEYEISVHADDERFADSLTVDAIEGALQHCELLEDYPNDPRGHSCLVLGFAEQQPVHVVCGFTKQGKVLLITIYRPTMPKWKNERTRNR